MTIEKTGRLEPTLTSFLTAAFQTGDLFSKSPILPITVPHAIRITDDEKSWLEESVKAAAYEAVYLLNSYVKPSFFQDFPVRKDDMTTTQSFVSYYEKIIKAGLVKEETAMVTLQHLVEESSTDHPNQTLFNHQNTEIEAWHQFPIQGEYSHPFRAAALEDIELEPSVNELLKDTWETMTDEDKFHHRNDFATFVSGYKLASVDQISDFLHALSHHAYGYEATVTSLYPPSYPIRGLEPNEQNFAFAASRKPRIMTFTGRTTEPDEHWEKPYLEINFMVDLEPTREALLHQLLVCHFLTSMFAKRLVGYKPKARIFLAGTRTHESNKKPDLKTTASAPPKHSVVFKSLTLTDDFKAFPAYQSYGKAEIESLINSVTFTNVGD